MSLLSHKTISLATILLFCLSFASAYRFLAMLPTAAPSHFIVGSSLMKGLARNGHDVTVVSPFPLKKPLANYHDLPSYELKKIMAEKSDQILDKMDRSYVESIIDLYDMGITLTDAILAGSAVQELLQTNQTFDAIICEVFLMEAIYGLSEHFNAPLVGFSTFGAHPWNTYMIGSPSPPSYVPSPMLPFTDRMNLLQRLANLAYIAFEHVFVDYYYLPKQEALYNRFFPSNKQSFYDIRKNAALVLVNQHVSLTSPRPYMPNQIEVGGLQINRERSPLPADIQKFIDEAEHGVIYFSMGSNLKSKNLPLEKREAILNTFRGLKQRVLWKFEEPKLVGKPNNVFISDWFPQDDILAHPNVRAFVTHGGLLSTTESIYHGKPFIGIPIFGDQFLNMARAENNGYGIKLDYTDLSAEAFKAAIKKITENPTYTKRVQDVSARFRDQPMQPLDLAVYWVEHVARHKGAEYMHCAGQDLNFIQYHSIDTLLILGGIVLSVIFLIFFLLRFIWRLLWSLCAKKEQKFKKH